MSILHHIHAYFYQHFGDSMYYILGFFLVLSVVAQWRLYEKAGQPGVAAVVPIWNFIVFLRIVGRPANHLWLFLIPVFGQLYMIPKVWIELCQSFGKRSLLDYVLVILLNGLYIFNLGMSYDTEYLGPVYGKHIPDNDNHAHPSLA
jgi:signal peptidase I